MALSFRLGKIPVRVQLWFFVLTCMLGAGDPRGMVAWVAIVFVSVLIHELGHATVGTAFGLTPAIELHGMGGTTSWRTSKKLSTAQRVAISLAGPFAGFAVGGIVFGLARAGVLPVGDRWDGIVRQLLFVNVGWGVFNLLPLLPLDGGDVMLQLLQAMTGGRGERPARIVSMVAVVLVGLVAYRYMGWWGGVLALSFLATNYQGLQALRAREDEAPMREALRGAHEALVARDAARALSIARPLALHARSAPVKAQALQLVAFAFLLEGRVADADAAIAAMPEGYTPDPQLLATRAAAIAATPGR